jgi:hypothetical protein
MSERWPDQFADCVQFFTGQQSLRFFKEHPLLLSDVGA